MVVKVRPLLVLNKLARVVSQQCIPLPFFVSKLDYLWNRIIFIFYNNLSPADCAPTPGDQRSEHKVQHHLLSFVLAIVHQSPHSHDGGVHVKVFVPNYVKLPNLEHLSISPVKAHLEFLDVLD